jgi:citronellyl-CoA dehydrogenase
MNRFTTEHKIFRESVRTFVANEITPNVLDWESAGEVPRDLFVKMGELGFLGVRLSDDWGGSELDLWYTTVLIQELVRCGSIGVPVSIMAHAEFGTKLIDRAGSDYLRDLFVRPAAAGKLIAALGVSEPNAGSDVAALETRAVRDGDEYVVDGSKTFITNGGIADFVTTAVRTGGSGHAGISLLVIPTNTPGFTVANRLNKIGTHASDTAELVFENCRVSAANLLGEENGGFGLIMMGFETERLVLSVMICAHMRLMWEEARRYGHVREAFGHSLLGFQSWRHRLADVITTIRAAEALTYEAIDLFVKGESCASEVSMAKLFAAESSKKVRDECAQIFGGNGYMEEFLIGRLQRDALAFSVGAGSSEIMRELIARSEGLNPKGNQ